MGDKALLSALQTHDTRRAGTGQLEEFVMKIDLGTPSRMTVVEDKK